MLNPNDLDVSALPSIPLSDCRDLPSIPAIYFAMSSGTIQYIGMSKNLRKRWVNHHHKKHLDLDADIAWIEVSNLDLLPQIEAALIQWFKPPLNIAGCEPDGKRSSLGSFASANGERLNKQILLRISERDNARLVSRFPVSGDRLDFIREAIAEKLDRDSSKQDI